MMCPYHPLPFAEAGGISLLDLGTRPFTGVNLYITVHFPGNVAQRLSGNNLQELQVEMRKSKKPPSARFLKFTLVHLPRHRCSTGPSKLVAGHVVTVGGDVVEGWDAGTRLPPDRPGGGCPAAAQLRWAGLLLLNHSEYLIGALVFLPPLVTICLLYTSPSPRDATLSRMPSSA